MNLWLRGLVVAFLFACSSQVSAELLAQQLQPISSPTAAPAQVKPKSTLEDAQGQPAQAPIVPQNDRIFWTMPNYLTVENASTLPSLTAVQKFQLISKDTFDPVSIVFVGLEAGVNQANNAEPTLGQGFKGYAKRYGLAFADNAIGNFMGSAVFPAMLHQDPRFYQMGTGGFLHRAWYAGTRVLVTRSDSGTSQINFSEILGNAAAAGISNAYHPGPRTVGSNINIWATQIAWDAFSYELKEFWPDIHRRFMHHR